MSEKQTKKVTRDDKKELLASFLDNVVEYESGLNGAVKNANQPKNENLNHQKI